MADWTDTLTDYPGDKLVMARALIRQKWSVMVNTKVNTCPVTRGTGKAINQKQLKLISYCLRADEN